MPSLGAASDSYLVCQTEARRYTQPSSDASINGALARLNF
jgi:hypothetical protein